MPPPLLRLNSSLSRGQVSSLDAQQSAEAGEALAGVSGTGNDDDVLGGGGKSSSSSVGGENKGNGRDSLVNSFDISAAGTLRLGSNGDSVQYDISRQGLASRNNRRGSGSSGQMKSRRDSGKDDKSAGARCADGVGGNENGEGDGEDDENVIGQVCAHDVMLSGVLGTGASSVVMRGISRRRHNVMAVKTVKVTDRERRQQLMSDLRALTSIGGESGDRIPGLVSFHGAYYEVDTNRLSICLEHMDYGSLADVLRRLNRTSRSRGGSPKGAMDATGAPAAPGIGFPEPVVRRIAHDVLLGLKHLHAHHVVHRDIKPPNILVNSSGYAKITDFGISAGLAHTQELCATWVGTVLYMSPERIESRGYSYSADVWSLGLTLMECATGAYPYGTGEGPLVLMLNVLEDPPPNLDSYDDMSDGLKVSLQCGSRHTHICEWYSYHTRDFSLIYLHTDSFRHVNVVVVHAPPHHHHLFLLARRAGASRRMFEKGSGRTDDGITAHRHEFHSWCSCCCRDELWARYIEHNRGRGRVQRQKRSSRVSARKHPVPGHCGQSWRVARVAHVQDDHRGDR